MLTFCRTRWWSTFTRSNISGMSYGGENNRKVTEQIVHQKFTYNILLLYGDLIRIFYCFICGRNYSGNEGANVDCTSEGSSAIDAFISSCKHICERCLLSQVGAICCWMRVEVTYQFAQYDAITSWMILDSNAILLINTTEIRLHICCKTANALNDVHNNYFVSHMQRKRSSSVRLNHIIILSDT